MTKPSHNSWLSMISRYLFFVAVANLLWEFAQLPLYTIWYEETIENIVFAAVHCTGGDVLIATASLIAAHIVTRCPEWPNAGFTQVAIITISFGLGYTVFSEWLNIDTPQSWAYADIMPTIPILGTGLSPLTQWIVIPISAFWWAKRPSFVNLKSAKASTT